MSKRTITVTIRAELPTDKAAIHKVETDAFGQRDEGDLVDQLREDDDFKSALSLVAIDEKEECVGHILFFPIKISKEGKTAYIISLGPVAVLTKYQVSGIGKQLIWKGIEVSKSLGYGAMVVLGHESYYPKFGFENTMKWNLKNPFGAPDEAYFAQEFEDGFLEQFSGGTIEYPKPFYE